MPLKLELFSHLLSVYYLIFIRSSLGPSLSRMNALRVIDTVLHHRNVQGGRLAASLPLLSESQAVRVLSAMDKLLLFWLNC